MINTGIALKEIETVCRPHHVGLHCHEVVHGKLVLGGRVLPMVPGNQNQTKSAQSSKRMDGHLIRNLALDEPPLEEQPRLLRQDRVLQHLAGDLRGEGAAARQSRLVLGKGQTAGS